ncbi:MAG: DUF3617 domain-containing protein [Sphingorhabdus sp.]
MRKLVIGGAVGALLALAACSDKGADADGDGKVSSAEAQKELSQGGAVAMNPGLWEVKIKFDSIEAPGLPEAAKSQMTKAMNEMSVKSCLTKEQAEKPGADFFGGDENSNCSFEQLNRSGNKMTVAMTCKPDGGVTVASKMEGSFEGDSYVMNMEQKTSGTPMGDMTMKGRIEGKRIGDCPA